MFQTCTPTMTIQRLDGPTAIELPNDYYSWAMDLAAIANTGEKILPAEIVFTKYKGRY